MKLRSLLSLTLAVAILSSCGVNDLEDRLDKVEGAIGTDEPIKVNFKTTNSEDVEITMNASHSIKPGYWGSYVEDNQNGTYYVYIERWVDVEGNEGSWIEFEFDAETKEVSEASARIYFLDKFRNYINPVFNPDNTGNTLEVTVKSFNAETGKISIQVSASTDETASNNEFEGNPMTCEFSFSGKLNVYID